MTTVVRVTVSKSRDTSVRVRLLAAPSEDGTSKVLAEQICDGRSCEVMFTEQIISDKVTLVVSELPAPVVANDAAPHVDGTTAPPAPDLTDRVGDAVRTDRARKPRAKKVS